MAGVVSATMKKLEITRFSIAPGLSMKVDPLGVLYFYFDDSTVEVVDVPKHVCKVGLMDRLFLTKDNNTYSPIAEFKVAQQKGMTEFAAAVIAFLRLSLYATRKFKVAKTSIQYIEKLEGSVSIKPETAEDIINAASFWYTAPSWIERYAQLRATDGFIKSKSVGETMFPWLMRAYNKDAHLCIVVSNFIESCLFAPMQRESLLLNYARTLEANGDWNMPEMYRKAFPEPIGSVCGTLAVAYSAMNMLVRKSEFTDLVSASGVVMRQLLFAFELALSAGNEKTPLYTDLSKILNLEEIGNLTDTLVALTTMCSIAKSNTLFMFSTVLVKKFGMRVDKSMEKDIKKSYAKAKKGETFTELQVLLGRLANLLLISIV